MQPWLRWLFIYKTKHNIVGIDVQKNAINEAKKNYGNKNFYCIPFEKLSKKINKKYDLICSFEVIEHLRNPMEFWNFASSNLKKNGEIVLSTPNGNLIPKMNGTVNYHQFIIHYLKKRHLKF